MSRRRTAREPAPFPHAAEARIKFASISLLLQLHAEIVRSMRAHRHAVAASHAPLIADIAAAGRDAVRALRASGYRAIVARESQRVARVIAAHVSDVVGWQVPPDDATPSAFTDAAWDKAEEIMDGMAECMAARLDEWLAGGFPPEALDASLQECQDKHASRWYWWLSLMMGWLAGKTTTTTHIAAGVTEAEWLTREDRRVRPAHHALQGVRFEYGDPPLKADVSSNGEDCYPGEDVNCRCTARIVATRR